MHSAPLYDDAGKYYFINGNNLIEGKIIIDKLETPKVSNEVFEKNNSQLDNNTVLLSINGTIGNLAYYQGENVMLGKSAAYLKVKNIEKKYLYTVLQTPMILRQFDLSLTGTTIKNLGLSAIKNTIVYMPIKEEQERIGEYFSQLDHLITLHQRKCDLLSKAKKTLLQKMFPKNGKTTPEIRFKGFTGAWEQRKLGEVGSVSMCRRIFKEQTSENGDIPFYKIGTFGGEADAFISREVFEEYRAKYPYPKKGDILLSASGSIGRIVEFTGKNEYFQDSNIVWLNHDERLDNSFLKCFYSIVKWAGIEGSTIKRLYNNNILNTVINLPIVEEQQKIGAYFANLDHLITLHQHELEKLQNIKKSCLKMMFV